LAVVDEPLELCVTRLRYAQIHGFCRWVVKLDDFADADPLAHPLRDVLPSPPTFGVRKRRRAGIPHGQSSGAEPSGHFIAAEPDKDPLSLRVNQAILMTRSDRPSECR
jgi:hypothetical protein